MPCFEGHYPTSNTLGNVPMCYMVYMSIVEGMCPLVRKWFQIQRKNLKVFYGKRSNCPLIIVFSIIREIGLSSWFDFLQIDYLWKIQCDVYVVRNMLRKTND